MERIYILTETSHSDGKTGIVDAYHNLADAQEDMKTRYESSKRFWGGMDEERNRFAEIYIQIGNVYAEAYAVDDDYEEVGMSWNIEAIDVK